MKRRTLELQSVSCSCIKPTGLEGTGKGVDLLNGENTQNLSNAPESRFIPLT